MKKNLRSIAAKLIKLYIFLLIVEDFDKCTLSRNMYHVIKYVTCLKIERFGKFMYFSKSKSLD